MPRRQFRLTIYPASVKHTLTVLVFPDRASLREYLAKVDSAHAWDSPEGDIPSGAFWSGPFNYGQLGHSGTIALNENDLDASTTVHECAHAAQHIYAMRYGSWSGRARRHMHGSNENFAYLMGDLTKLLLRRLQAAGYTVTS